MAVNTVISTNVISLNANRNLKKVNRSLSVSTERVSSGLKINSSEDDSAGLSMSQKMKAQLRGLDKAEKNTEDTIEMFNVIEGALTELGEIFQRSRELSVQAASDTNTVEDKRKIATEILEVLQEVDYIRENAKFNGVNVFDNINRYFQVGSNSGQYFDFKEEVLPLRELMSSPDMELFNFINNFFNETVRDAIDTILELDPYKIGNTCTIYTVDTALVDYKKYLESVFEAIDTMESFGITEVEEIIKDMRTELNGVIQESRDKAVQELTQRVQNGNGTDMSPDLWLDNAFGEGSIMQEDTKTPPEGNERPYADSIRTNVDHVIAVIQDENKVVVIDSDLGKEDPDSFPNRLEEVLKEYSEKLLDPDLYIMDYLKELESFVAGDITISAKRFSQNYISIFDTLIDYVSEKRDKIGISINRLEYTLNNLKVTEENLYSANSCIEDADIAQEMMNLTKANVLTSAATSLLAQSNSSKEDILQLLF